VIARAAGCWYQRVPVTNHRTAAALTALALSTLAPPAAAQHDRRRRETPPATPPPAAPAAAPDELEAEHARGVELRRQHRDAEARDLFRALHERSHASRALAWQAGAEAALGDWVNAERHLAAALDDANDPWVNQLRAELTADLAGFRQRVGRLEVLSSTPGAEVWVAGERAASLPLERPLVVRAGAVAVEVRAAGHVTEVRTVQVPPGLDALARETVNLTPQPVAITATVTANILTPPPPPPPADSGPIHPLRIAGAIALGLGGVGVGLGIYGLVSYSSKHDDYVNAGCDVASPPADCAGFDGGASSLTLGIVGLSAGGALAIGGLVMMLVPVRRGAPARTVTVAPGPGALGLSLRATF